MSGDILVTADGPVLSVTFNRPEQRNAMTFEMYEGLVAACERADSDPGIRAVVLRGAGGAAFVAGTDIAQFSGFDGSAGVAYEKTIDATIRRLLDVRVPVVAAIDGFCVGGGLAIAAAADIRIAAPGARFGYPIARTLGNTLSGQSYALTLRHFGHARTVDMVMTARLFTAEDLIGSGFISEIAEDVGAATEQVVTRVVGHAPLTLWAAKETLRRLHDAAGSVNVDDVVERVYGSADFASGVAAFTTKTRPDWSGT
jgi:enoyl-CoA hydratase/carnithine racemase